MFFGFTQTQEEAKSANSRFMGFTITEALWARTEAVLIAGSALLHTNI
jgi:hypothetical protein